MEHQRPVTDLAELGGVEPLAHQVKCGRAPEPCSVAQVDHFRRAQGLRDRARLTRRGARGPHHHRARVDPARRRRAQADHAKREERHEEGRAIEQALIHGRRIRSK